MTRTDVLERLESIERELDRLEMAIIEKAGGEAAHLRSAMKKRELGMEKNLQLAGQKAGRLRKEAPALALLS